MPLSAPEHVFVSELSSTGMTTTSKPSLPRQEVYSAQGQVEEDPKSTSKPDSITVPETKTGRTKMSLIVEAESTAMPSSHAEQPLTTSKAVAETSGSVRSLREAEMQEAEMPAPELSPETGNEKAAD